MRDIPLNAELKALSSGILMQAAPEWYTQSHNTEPGLEGAQHMELYIITAIFPSSFFIVPSAKNKYFPQNHTYYKHHLFFGCLWVCLWVYTCTIGHLCVYRWMWILETNVFSSTNILIVFFESESLLICKFTGRQASPRNSFVSGSPAMEL